MSESKKRTDKEILVEMRELLIKAAFKSDRMLYGACHYFQCIFCAKTGDYCTPVNSEYAVKHDDFCPIGKILLETEIDQ